MQRRPAHVAGSDAHVVRPRSAPEAFCSESRVSSWLLPHCYVLPNKNRLDSRGPPSLNEDIGEENFNSRWKWQRNSVTSACASMMLAREFTLSARSTQKAQRWDLSKKFYHKSRYSCHSTVYSTNNTRLSIFFKQNSTFHSLHASPCYQPSVTDTRFSAWRWGPSVSPDRVPPPCLGVNQGHCWISKEEWPGVRGWDSTCERLRVHN